jgi:hypothetical protein
LEHAGPDGENAMTLYTIVSIVIALCGATFTAITQFSSFFGVHVSAKRADSANALGFIASQLSDSGRQKKKAKGRDKLIGIFDFIWKTAGFPPVLILLVFAFRVAFRVLGGLGQPESTAITDDAVNYYRAWLWWVIWIDLASLGLKIIALLIVEGLAYLQHQCRQTLVEKMPVGQTITPELPTITVAAPMPQLPPAQ